MWVCRGLDGYTWSECLPVGMCGFEPQKHVPRTPARASTCARGPGGLPACHGAESTKKTRSRKRNKMPKGQKNTFICICIYSTYVLPRMIRIKNYNITAASLHVVGAYIEIQYSAARVHVSGTYYIVHTLQQQTATA